MHVPSAAHDFQGCNARVGVVDVAVRAPYCCLFASLRTEGLNRAYVQPKPINLLTLLINPIL